MHVRRSGVYTSLANVYFSEQRIVINDHACRIAVEFYGPSFRGMIDDIAYKISRPPIDWL